MKLLIVSDEQRLDNDMTNTRIKIPRDLILDFCKRWKIAELSFFGSVLRDDFNTKSDIDVLVAFEPKTVWSLFEHVMIQDDLTAILGRQVDLVSKKAIEKSHNWIRKQNILKSAEIYYAA